MSTKTMVRQRNQAIECWRMIAAFLVVCLHCELPGGAGIAVQTVSRLAVPFFFAVSGYFSYRADARQVKKRTVNVLKLLVLATLVHVFFGILYVRYVEGLDVIQRFRNGLPLRAVFSDIILNKNPIAGHLWYLNALFWTQGFFLLYTLWAEGKADYRPLYYSGAFLFVIFLFLDTIYPSVHEGLSFTLFRNAWFFGIPMFVMGLFLREHHEKLVRVFRLTKGKLYSIMLGGIFLALMQRYGVSGCELPVGMVIVVMAVLILCGIAPQITEDPLLSRMISKFAGLSAFVYITHILWLNAYMIYWEPACASALGGTVAVWMKPVIVFMLSLVSGILWDLMVTGVRRIRKT